MCHPFWRNPALPQEPERESPNQSVFYPLHPFYIGLFKYSGELHEGKHEPIISKKLFDEAQEMLKFRDNPSVNHKTNRNHIADLFPVLHAE